MNSRTARIAIVATGATVLIGGVTAAAFAAEPATAGQGTPAAAATHGGGHGFRARDVQHGEWVTRDSSGADTTHELIHGQVTAVSTTSVAVKAADGTAETYVVNGSTKVVKAGGKGVKRTTIAIGDVKNGDTVVVLGTKSGSTDTATAIVETA